MHSRKFLSFFYIFFHGLKHEYHDSYLRTGANKQGYV